jgi:cytochrome c oxidase subunit III
MAERHAGEGVKEWFESLEKQEHAARIGMWLFLASETLLFAALFALYFSYRAMYTADFTHAIGHNYLAIGTVNTIVLLTSGFFVAWAVHAMRGGRSRTTAFMLALAVGLGLLFIGLKLVEYGLHAREGILPGQYYAFAAMPGYGARLFFTSYYFLTGLHLLHLAVAIGLMAWLMVRALRGTMTARRHTALEMGALYWGMVDVIWVLLYPLLYVTG